MRLLLCLMLALCAAASSAKEFKTETKIVKEGSESLRWDFRKGSVYEYKAEKPFALSGESFARKGIKLWIYNPKPSEDSLRLEFLSPQGVRLYEVGFYLRGKGWRACWSSFANMTRLTDAYGPVSSFRIVAPQRKGTVYIDRIIFPDNKVNVRTTPDAQMPRNNTYGYAPGTLYHWCRTYEWECLDYDMPLPESLTAEQEKELEAARKALSAMIIPSKVQPAAIKKAQQTFERASIRPLKAGAFAGLPLVDPDERRRDADELILTDVETMLYGFAQDVLFNGSKESLKRYFLVWDYAMNQGFAYGSGMGTNHHYGYKLRNAFVSVWMMRDYIERSRNRDAIMQTVRYWSALPETRIPYQYGRDGVVDAWHTLLTPKIIAALSLDTPCECWRAMKCLSRWLGASLLPSPGTVGGFKADGTCFHHGGFYPAYTTGALGAIGSYLKIVEGTSFQLSEDALCSFRDGLVAMRDFCTLREWGIGVSGRHPFGGFMKKDDVDAFASLSIAKGVDESLAADYLRLCEGLDNEDAAVPSPEARMFHRLRIDAALDPEGFFVFNHGCFGVYRGQGWMVSLKGYNTDVWGSEIYVKDNRYGRYQSYGSAQIMTAPTRRESGFVPEGWDWNRLPGTTSIHLPFEELDSPLPGTTMKKSREDYAGASSLEGRCGMFSMKLAEGDLPRFTPDFVARKSVFCFDGVMVCVGTGISNSNSLHATETTLFQTEDEAGERFDSILPSGSDRRLSDGRGNEYLIPSSNADVHFASQILESRDEKTRARNTGAQKYAVIDHGNAPKEASYEYCVLLPGRSADCTDALYERLRFDNCVHALRSKADGSVMCSFFEKSSAPVGIIMSCDAETMVIYREDADGSVLMSVCSPAIDLADKSYSAASPSRPALRRLTLNGSYEVLEAGRVVVGERRDADPSPVSALESGETTVIEVVCSDGLPVEFRLR